MKLPLGPIEVDVAEIETIQRRMYFYAVTFKDGSTFSIETLRSEKALRDSYHAQFSRIRQVLDDRTMATIDAHYEKLNG